MPKWPRDNQAELIAFYGDPGKGEVARQLVKVTPPFQLYYTDKNGKRPLKTISFHKKAAPALEAALNEIWEKSGRNQVLLDKEGISDCAGTYNPRKVRGSATKWSNHAFGAAIDLDAKGNFLGDSTPDMPQFVIDAFKRQGARWGGDYTGRKDGMHFEFCRDADADTFGIIDLPHSDADTDDISHEIPDAPPPHNVAPDYQPWWKRTWAKVTGGGFSLTGLGAALYDWRVALIVGVVIIVVFVMAWPTIKRKLEAM